MSKFFRLLSICFLFFLTVSCMDLLTSKKSIDPRRDIIDKYHKIFQIYDSFVEKQVVKPIKVFHLPHENKIINGKKYSLPIRIPEIDSLDYLSLGELEYYAKKYLPEEKYNFVFSKVKNSITLENEKLEYLFLYSNYEQLSNQPKYIDEYLIVFDHSDPIESLIDFHVDQKPNEEVDREDIRDFVMRYYFGRINDELYLQPFAYAGLSESIEHQIYIDIFGVPNNLEDLVFSDIYKDFDIDSFFIDILEQMFRTQITFLEADEYSKVMQVNLNLNKRLDENLWLNINAESMYISPNLVRAVFIYTNNELERIIRYKDKYYTEHAYHGLQTMYFDRELSTEDMEGLYSLFINKFKDSFNFIIAHELAHLYLGDGYYVIDDEFKCDCAAINHMIDFNGYFDYGIFVTMISKSVEIGREDIWEFNTKEASSEVLKRTILLKKYSGTSEKLDCNKYY